MGGARPTDLVALDDAMNALARTGSPQSAGYRNALLWRAERGRDSGSA